MGLALRLYEQLTETTDERVRLRLIADAIGELEESWPRAGEIARSSDVRESELRLQREIEVVRREIEVVRREIEGVRKETKEVELHLQKEIKEVELSLKKEIKEVELGLKKEIEVVRKEIKGVELSMRTAMHQHTLWVIGAVGTIVGLVKVLDWLLA